MSSFRPIPPINMAAKGNSCFWLANVKQIFFSETAWPNGAKLGRKHLCKILYKNSSFGSIGPANMATVTKNRTYGKIAPFCNNSKTVNNIRNLTRSKWLAEKDLTTLKFGRKSDYISWSYCSFFIQFSKFEYFSFFI